MTVSRRETSAVCFLALAMAACSSSTGPTGPRSGSQLARNVGATPGSGTAGKPAPDSNAIAATDNPNAAFIPTAPTKSDTSIAGNGLRADQCAGKNINTMRVVPTIWLVIDGSGSMVDTFGDTSRWKALKEALMDPMVGVVKTLEHQVQWGMIMYDGPTPAPIQLPDGGTAMFSSPPAKTCPRVVAVEPKKDNFADINMVYPPDPLGGSTPTDKALAQVIQHLPPSAATAGPDVFVQPTIIVLATDGEPNDLCSMSFGPPPDVKPAVIAAVKQLLDAGDKTYVISLAGTDQGLASHLQDVAKAGGTGMPPFSPMNKDDLIAAFKAIIGPETTCDVTLSGKVKMGNECMGTIQINGKPLDCNSDNGWRLKDMATISITGTACDAYKADPNAMLVADFPCEAILLN
jgi:hypothetical protein